MEIKYFDSHSHLNFPQYDEDRDGVIKEMKEISLATIAVGTDKQTSKESVALANTHENIWATIGVHPTDSKEGFDEEYFESLLGPRVVGVGECGLDYFRSANRTDEDKARQKETFKAQIEFALKHDLPLMLHMRPSTNTMDAYEDGLEILEEYHKEHGSKLRGNAHFFVGNIDIAKRFLDIGFTIAFPGVITFAPEYEEVVKYVPIESILSETDAPFASPEPFRGKRNNPLYVRYIVDKIASLKGVSPAECAEAMVSNAKRVFNIEI